MCVIKEIGRFLKKGADTFREASQGRYYEESEAIDELKKRCLAKKKSAPMTRLICYVTADP